MPIGVNTNWLNLLPQVAKLALPIFTVSKIKKGITNTALHLVATARPITTPLHQRLSLRIRYKASSMKNIKKISRRATLDMTR